MYFSGEKTPKLFSNRYLATAMPCARPVDCASSHQLVYGFRPRAASARLFSVGESPTVVCNFPNKAPNISMLYLFVYRGL
jgi:hypothetical protein